MGQDWEKWQAARYGLLNTVSERPLIVDVTAYQEAEAPAVHEHASRVGQYASLLASALGFSADQQRDIAIAAPLHDIGKSLIDDRIVVKPGPLTPEEWAIMRSHTTLSHGMLHGTGDRLMDLAADIARTHHECYDGSGYPSGIAGDDIPMPGRIAAVCDVYDALREHRSYKPGLDHARAVDIILRGDDRTHPEKFDPQVLAAFAVTQDRFAKLFDAEEQH